MSDSATRISLLGRTAIERDGVPVALLSGRRAELVFAYLAVEHRRSVSRDELADALWPGMLPDTWNAALRGVLSDVRRALERAGLPPADTLLTEQGRVRLQLPAGVTLDIDEAHAALAHARAASEAGDCSRAAALASEAADAAAQPFLPFHDDGWASDVRARLEGLHIDALLLAGRAQLDAGDPHAALAASDRLLRADPFLEAAHRLRIESLGRSSDRAGALRAYERCAALLQAELGIDPSPETHDTLRRALQGDDIPAAPSSDGTAAAGPSAGLAVSKYTALSVLVVEDHDFQRRTTLTLLRGLGVGTLHEAADGAAALALLDDPAKAPDVIVCDIDMPGMDGVEFIRHVGERGLASAVVIASGLEGRVLETVRAASQGYGLQVLGAVAKPLTAAALEHMLATYRPRTAVDPAAPIHAGREQPSDSLGVLLASLRGGSLPVDFEPIVDLATGEVAALRPRVASPLADELPPAADEAGLGRVLVEHLLREVAAAAAARDVTAFVPLTPDLLTDVSLADALSAITRERVVLVACARALAACDGPALLDVLARLRIKGYGLCVEGVEPRGLESYPLTHIALRPELIVAAATTGDLTPLQPAVAASRRLGVPMLGRCETAEEFELLLRLGCSYTGGGYMASAVPTSAGVAVGADG